MSRFYMLLAGGVFFLFCLLEMRGVVTDRNDITPKPSIYTSRGGRSSTARGSSGSWFYSSK